MTKIVPSDEEVLWLLARRRELTAELEAINTTLRSIVHNDSLPREKRAHRGRPKDDINEWAAQTIADGGARADVYQQWLKRKGLDDDAKAKDAFRKMLIRHAS